MTPRRIEEGEEEKTDMRDQQYCKKSGNGMQPLDFWDDIC
jgi:hypothetical protein